MDRQPEPGQPRRERPLAAQVTDDQRGAARDQGGAREGGEHQRHGVAPHLPPDVEEIVPALIQLVHQPEVALDGRDLVLDVVDVGTGWLLS